MVLGAASVAACGASSSDNGSDAATTDRASAPDVFHATDAGVDTSTATDTGGGTDVTEVDGGTCTSGDPYGAATDYPVGTYTLASSTLQLIIGRDGGGLYAYSASCTHTGCTVPAPDGTTGISMCPCHGSRFDSNGVVQPGSLALRDLPHFALAVCDGQIVVDRFTTVPATTRWML